jgi:hypothetical protein
MERGGCDTIVDTIFMFLKTSKCIVLYRFPANLNQCVRSLNGVNSIKQNELEEILRRLLWLLCPDDDIPK